MTERFDLPPKLLTQMYFFVSSALKREILKRSDLLDPALIDEAVNNNRKKILSTAVRDVRSEVAAARQYVQDKVNANAVNEALLKELIECRRSTEFLLAFAHHIGVDSSTAQAILKDRTWESLAIACRAAHLERTTFAKIVFGMQKNETDQNKALRILDLYLKIPQEAAERVMRFWRVRAQSAGDAENAARARPSIHDIPQKAAG